MKMMRFGLSSSVVLLGILAALACERRSDTPKEPVRTSPAPAPLGPLGPSSMQEASRPNPERTPSDGPASPTRGAVNESAVSAITVARCDREERCDNVGNGKKYSSKSDCMTKTRADWRDDLNARKCPQRIVSSQLASCVDQIKSESCGNPVEKLESVLACRTVDLCKRS